MEIIVTLACLIILIQVIVLVKRIIVGDWNPKAMKAWKSLNKMRDECDRLFISMKEPCNQEEELVRIKAYNSASKSWRDGFITYSKKYLRNKNRYQF